MATTRDCSCKARAVLALLICEAPGKITWLVLDSLGLACVLSLRNPDPGEKTSLEGFLRFTGRVGSKRYRPALACESPPWTI
jgi:hypothetical protein